MNFSSIIFRVGGLFSWSHLTEKEQNRTELHFIVYSTQKKERLEYHAQNHGNNLKVIGIMLLYNMSIMTLSHHIPQGKYVTFCMDQYSWCYVPYRECCSDGIRCVK